MSGWPLIKKKEIEINVAETRMLRWMLDVTELDRIINEYIRGNLKITNIVRKNKIKYIEFFPT